MIGECGFNHPAIMTRSAAAINDFSQIVTPPRNRYDGVSIPLWVFLLGNLEEGWPRVSVDGRLLPHRWYAA